MLGVPSKRYTPDVAAEDRSWKALGEFIRAQRRLANLSLRQAAKLAQVSNPYLSQIERGLYKPSAEVLSGIAQALKISAETLYARAGLLKESKRERTDTQSAIRFDPLLSTEQKEALIKVYRSFVNGPGPSI